MSTETTHRNPSAFSEGFNKAPAERETGAEAFGLRSNTETLRNRLSAAGQLFRAWIVPPSLLTEPMASMAELTAYAYRGRWTADRTGFIRGIGKLWFTVIVLPVAYLLRLAEWLIQRPSRAIVATGIWLLIAHSDGPGPWLIDNVFRPFWSCLGWIFLP